MKSHKISTLMLTAILAASVQATTPAYAGDNHDRDQRDGVGNRCDVVSLSGTARLLEGGRLVGEERLSVLGSDKEFAVKVEMVTLGTVAIDPNSAAVTLATSHDFSGERGQGISFTTFEEIQVIPLGGTDATCSTNACGLIFTLKLETGTGSYTCGRIVSGLNPDPNAPVPFTSYVNPHAPAANGDTVFLNSTGKLCRCRSDN